MVSGCLRDSQCANLDPDALPLPANRFAEVVHLGADNVVDRFARAIHVLAHRIRDVFHWYRVYELFSALSRGAVTLG
jgi:hypothetical protein